MLSVLKFYEDRYYKPHIHTSQLVPFPAQKHVPIHSVNKKTRLFSGCRARSIESQRSFSVSHLHFETSKISGPDATMGQRTLNTLESDYDKATQFLGGLLREGRPSSKRIAVDSPNRVMISGGSARSKIPQSRPISAIRTQSSRVSSAGRVNNFKSTPSDNRLGLSVGFINNFKSTPSDKTSNKRPQRRASHNVIRSSESKRYENILILTLKNSKHRPHPQTQLSQKDRLIAPTDYRYRVIETIIRDFSLDLIPENSEYIVRQCIETEDYFVIFNAKTVPACRECKLPAEFQLSQTEGFSVMCRSGFCTIDTLYKSGLNNQARNALWEEPPIIDPASRTNNNRMNNNVSIIIQSGNFKKRSIEKELVRPRSSARSELYPRDSILSKQAEARDTQNSREIVNRENINIRSMLMSFRSNAQDEVLQDYNTVDPLRRKVIIHSVQRKNSTEDLYKGAQRILSSRLSLKPQRISPLIEVLPVNVDSHRTIFRDIVEEGSGNQNSENSLPEMRRKSKYAIDESSHLMSFMDNSRTERADL